MPGLNWLLQELVEDVWSNGGEDRGVWKVSPEGLECRSQAQLQELFGTKTVLLVL